MRAICLALCLFLLTALLAHHLLSQQPNPPPAPAADPEWFYEGGVIEAFRGLIGDRLSPRQSE
jgi:hypothetical protein